MSDLETRKLLEHIDHTLRVRWWIFTIAGIALVVNSMATCSNLIAIQRFEKKSVLWENRALENKAAIDATIKQQLVFQQQLVQYWDALAKRNPKVNVPRVTVHPPASSPSEISEDVKLSDAELTRSPIAKATPTPSARHSKKKYKPTASPTPGVLQRLFQPKSTR